MFSEQTSALTASVEAKAYPPEQRIVVASLLSMSGGFMDAFTWIWLGGVFANSQTGNVVFIGVNAALGKWQDAGYHVFPIFGFVAGAWIATRVRAPLRCLAGEAVALGIVMTLLLNGLPATTAIIGLSFGVALQTVSFRQVERWKYLSITVTGNMLREIEEEVTSTAPQAVRGAWTMFLLCVMFLIGAIIGGLVTTRLGGLSLLVPIVLQVSALSFCCWHRYRNRHS